MNNPVDIANVSGKVLADGAQTIRVDEQRRGTKMQICIYAGTATAGTVTPTVKSRGAPNAESILDASGNAVVVTLTANSSRTFVFDGAIDSVTLTPAGTNGTYGFIITGL